MNSEKNTSTAEEKEAKIVSSADLKKVEEKDAKDEEDTLKIVFKKPITWEDETYKEIDLSGLEDLSARDMIQAQRAMEKSGSMNVMPELSLEYACIMASKATGIPVEFFQNLPMKESGRLKNRITTFIYGED